jgi:sporulation protein YabP
MGMVEERMDLPHKLTLNDRKQLTMTGVCEVISFDDTAVILRTTMGTLTVQGSQLQLKTLSLDGGQVAVEGTVCALQYEEERSTAGWKRRLFG